jgi:hypothetical protein
LWASPQRSYRVGRIAVLPLTAVLLIFDTSDYFRLRVDSGRFLSVGNHIALTRHKDFFCKGCQQSTTECGEEKKRMFEFRGVGGCLLPAIAASSLIDVSIEGGRNFLKPIPTHGLDVDIEEEAAS